MSPSDNVDGRVQNRIENYTGFWAKDTAQEKAELNDNRVENYTEVVNGYYDGATELYEFAWAQSFHFSRFYKGESFAASLARHEHYLASNMGLTLVCVCLTSDVVLVVPLARSPALRTALSLA